MADRADIRFAKIEAGRYRVVKRGRPTKIVVEKSPDKSWGALQEWDVSIEGFRGDGFLFAARSKADAFDVLEALDAELSGGAS